jgi:hypothetical protein
MSEFASLKEYRKAYYQKNKQQLNAKTCEKVACDICNKQIVKKYVNKHKETPKCKL